MRKRKKILYIHHAGGIGGAPRSLAFLIHKLDKDVYEPIVLSIERGPANKLFESAGAQVLIADNIRPYHATTVSGMSWTRFIRNNLFLFPSILLSAYYLNKIKPDLIHLNTTCLFAFAVAAKLLVLRKIKVITHVREPLLVSFSGNILRTMNYYFTDWDIPICKYDQSKLRERKNSTVVYNFVDFNDYDSSISSVVLRNELNINQESLIVTFLGRVSESNGVLELVQFATKISKEVDDMVFVIIGMPEISNDYSKKVESNSAGFENIHLLKFRNDIREVLSDSDIHVCPFTRPHFSRGVIEASAMGVPSIGNNIGGVNELISDDETGVLYDGSFYDFREKLFSLRDDIYRKNLGNAAEEVARQRFNAEINTKLVFSIYTKLLS